MALPGVAQPYGVSIHEGGLNFAVYAGEAEQCILLLYRDGQVQRIELDPETNRTGDVWHICLTEAAPLEYAYELVVEGKTIGPLLDPYAPALASQAQWGERKEPRGVVLQEEPFDWEGDQPLCLPWEQLVIYEMHVRGYTNALNSPATHRGTFLGVIEAIDHLKRLGVTAVELLPIFEFDETDNPRSDPTTGKPLWQYWGYSSVSFMAPMNRFATAGDGATARREFRQMVKALHQAGIEVILDVVFNHTGESADEPLSWRGFAPWSYYILEEGNDTNYTGCGNTVSANHPVTRELIIECLRRWVVEMHVDGFRFDLAAALTRGTDGVGLANPPLIEAMAKDPVLANTKLVAEAWDASGLYLVGDFPHGDAFAEWNGPYRDLVRRFIKGDQGQAGYFATRLCGSQDLYGGRTPCHSVNFITAHDGFTLYDLVAYNSKHNENNGEENRDGTDANYSWNCGEEGPSDDPLVLARRHRQQRNLHLALMLSRGVPMIRMGDEVAHTQFGNNNSWCHDSPLTWLTWESIHTESAWHRFFRETIALRLRHPALRADHFVTGGEIVWHGEQPNHPNWSNSNQLVAFTLRDPEAGDLYCAFNAAHQPVTLHLPRADTGKHWHRLIHTALSAPQDLRTPDQSTPLQRTSYRLPAYSALVLHLK